MRKSNKQTNSFSQILVSFTDFPSQERVVFHARLKELLAQVKGPDTGPIFNLFTVK